MKKVVNLKKLREARGLTQLVLADRMGVDQARISRWETGEKTPFPHTVQAIAKALRCKVEELV